MPPREQAAYLKGACAEDPQLRAQVEALLLADKDTASLLSDIETQDANQTRPNTRTSDRASVSTESAGEQIGRYKLLQSIGEGGFGTVWMAEQREPVKRRVALKVIKLGMDTKQVIARFEAERQALAMMDHPHIAKVLDAGATDLGRPYFVMEYIKGVPIIEYCDTEKLDTKGRLALFTQVCNAIQHAHQKGIIHRDIKPSNILVTMHDGVPVCKVIDFGIAKATSTELTQKTLFTEHRQLIGTPAYMSPEQAEMSGLDIDTRTDIYALGVLLYELLTGTTPFDTESLMQAGFGEMIRIIREQEPHKPSTRLSTLGDTATRTAQQRRVDIKQLNAILRGDLDWIVMKCLEKDRTRRYETANALALDIERHLNDEPVLAGAPTSGYKLRKFIRRNRRQVVAGTALACVVVLGLAGTSYGMAWALKEKDRADEARVESENQRVAAEEARQSAEEQTAIAKAQLDRSEEFKSFMVELLGSIEPNQEFPERSLAIRELIDTAIDRLESGNVRDASARTEVIELLSDTARRHFWHDIQADLMRVMHDEALSSYGRNDIRTVSAAVWLAQSLLTGGQAQEASQIVDDYMPSAKLLDENSGTRVNELRLLTVSAAAQSIFSNFERALEEANRALALAKQFNSLPEQYFTHAVRGRSLQMLGRFDESLEASDAAKRIIDEYQGEIDASPWVIGMWLNNRAGLMTGLGEHDKALDMYLQAAEHGSQTSPDDYAQHFYRFSAAQSLQILGRTQEAIELAIPARTGLSITRAPEAYIRNCTRLILQLLNELGRDDEYERERAAFLQAPSMPLSVYKDGTDRAYTPSALMGQTDKAFINLLSSTNPYEGEFCFELAIQPGNAWVALGWVEPPNNWGDLPGGYDLTGTSKLTFMARGARGGEQVTVGIGVIDSGNFADTARIRVPIELSTEWQQFDIPLQGADLSIVRGGFLIESVLTQDPQTIYFDNIRFE